MAPYRDETVEAQIELATAANHVVYEGGQHLANFDGYKGGVPALHTVRRHERGHLVTTLESAEPSTKASGGATPRGGTKRGQQAVLPVAYVQRLPVMQPNNVLRSSSTKSRLKLKTRDVVDTGSPCDIAANARSQPARAAAANVGAGKPMRAAFTSRVTVSVADFFPKLKTSPAGGTGTRLVQFGDTLQQAKDAEATLQAALTTGSVSGGTATSRKRKLPIEVPVPWSSASSDSSSMDGTTDDADDEIESDNDDFA